MAVLHVMHFQRAKDAADWVNNTGSALPGFTLIGTPTFDPASIDYVVWYWATS
jgi:hypothetical protein